MLPVDDGLLVIRRGIDPGRNRLALPGGYVDFAESWQQAAVRELHEETAIKVNPADVSLFDVASARDGSILVFGLARGMKSESLPPFEPTAETTARLVVTVPTDLAFALHTAAVRSYFERGRM